MSKGRIVFRNANLVDGKSAAQPRSTIVVEGTRISDVIAGGDVESTSADRVFDLGGKTLMPGMVQGHFHSHFGAFGDGVRAPSLGLEAAPAYLSMLAVQNAQTALDFGFTGAIGASNAHTIDVSLKEAIKMGVVKGPRYLAGSREIVTTGEYSDYDSNRHFYMQLGDTGLTYKADGPEAWQFAARVEAGRGCDVIKISAGPGHGSSPARDICYPTNDELNALVEAAHKLGSRVRAHAPSRASILACARAGVEIIDHADRIDDECIEAILDNGCTVVPSMLWSRRFLDLAESWDHDAEVLPISEGFRETPEEVRARIARVHEDYDYTLEAMVKAHRAGVRMIVGDDYGTPIMPHGDYAAELELYVKELGIAPLDVIGWATRNGAEAMRLGDEAGLIEAGRYADLIVVDGDPSVDVSCLADRERIETVLIGGEFQKGPAA